MKLLPLQTNPDLDYPIFFDLLAKRLGMLSVDAQSDSLRVANWFVRWWRTQGGKSTAQMKFPPVRQAAGWGFDFDWGELESLVAGKATEKPMSLEDMFYQRICAYYDDLSKAAGDGLMVSSTQQKKRDKEAELGRRKEVKQARRQKTNSSVKQT